MPNRLNGKKLAPVSMKILHLTVILPLFLLVGCARNSDVAALKSEVANLKERISAAENDAQEKSDSLQAKCDELEQGVAKLKDANSELASGIHYQVASALAAESEISKLGVQLAEMRMRVDAMGPLIDTKEDTLNVLKMKDRFKICEEGASSIKRRLDDMETHNELQEMDMTNNFKQIKNIFQARDETERMADLAFFHP